MQRAELEALTDRVLTGGETLTGSERGALTGRELRPRSSSRVAVVVIRMCTTAKGSTLFY